MVFGFICMEIDETGARKHPPPAFRQTKYSGSFRVKKEINTDRTCPLIDIVKLKLAPRYVNDLRYKFLNQMDINVILFKSLVRDDEVNAEFICH